MAVSTGLSREVLRTTVDLPVSLVREADAALKRGAAKSRNVLMTKALEAYLRELREREIDAQFAAMKDDERYCKEMLQIAEEFADADWEALQVSEGKRETAGSSRLVTKRRRTRG